MRKALTAIAVDAIKPMDRPFYVSDAKQDGLRVRVAPSGLLTWNVAFRVKGGGTKSVSLGRCDTAGKHGLDIASARERAANILKAAREGRDLVSEEEQSREAAREAMAISDLIDRYGQDIARPQRRGGALRTATQIERRLRRALATKLNSPVDAITRKQVMLILDQVAEVHPREAEKRRQVIRGMFTWGMAKGFASGNPVAGTPSYSLGQPRDRALSDDEIKSLWEWLDSGADRMSPDVITVLKLQLLTGARVNEVAGMQAIEFSREGDRLLWVLPASRSKNKKPRVTPISGRIRSIIEQAVKARPVGPLFRTLDGTRALTSSDVGATLNNRKRPIAHFTTHDLRRTVVSQMDAMGIALDTIAAVVGHQRGGRETQTLVRHYAHARLDERVETALASWEDHLTAVVGGRPPTGNVITFAARSG